MNLRCSSWLWMLYLSVCRVKVWRSDINGCRALGVFSEIRHLIFNLSILADSSQHVAAVSIIITNKTQTDHQIACNEINYTVLQSLYFRYKCTNLLNTPLIPSGSNMRKPVIQTRRSNSWTITFRQKTSSHVLINCSQSPIFS